jgi:Flp pilus assembly pilin Flp
MAETLTLMRGTTRLRHRAGDPQSRSQRRPRQCVMTIRLITRLVQEETGVTSLEYVMVTIAVALAAIAASRTLAEILVSYLQRVYLVVTLPIP